MTGGRAMTKKTFNLAVKSGPVMALPANAPPLSGMESMGLRR